ncbi:MAG TPA: arsenite methyltransferase [Bacteroidales bacterium]|nr:arsenite methyltransferase [Bacteroidales bacterium]
MQPQEVKNIVKEKYGKIVESDSDTSCCCGSSCCGPQVDYTIFSENYKNKQGYNPDADLNLGCGIPTDFAGIKPGDHILDLGSGAGNDCFVARALVGETGRVTGIDMTEQMIRKARENCKRQNFNNVEFVEGDIEAMPFAGNSFDVVISNCVLNLVPEKRKAFMEIFRVLKPGGHFCVSDVVIKGSLSERMQKDAEMYAGCVSGASKMEDYLKLAEESGFKAVEIHKEKEIRLPEELLSEFNDYEEMKMFKEGKTGIFSLTVSAEKPE